MDVDRDEKMFFGIIGGWFIFVGILVLVACGFAGWALIHLVDWVTSQ